MSTYRFSHTDAVHAGRDDFRSIGAHAPPIDLSSTYPVGDPDTATASLDALCEGQAQAAEPVYARLHNPTVARWEQALARAENAEAAVAFGSGMAALTAALLSLPTDRRHVVAVRPVYGTSDHLLASGLLGQQVSWTTPDRIADQLRADTGLVIIETPANPTLALIDIEAVVRQAGEIPVLVDSTFATPVLQRPLELGAAMVMHSATKFLGGHGDVMAGVIACNEARARGLRQVRIATGALLHPWAAFLLHRSMPTLRLRVERAQATALKLAERLARHPAVAQVHYPGLSGQDPMGLIGRQMDGPGSVLAFEVHGGHESATGLLGTLKLITPAVSLGSVDSLIQHPAGLTHRVMDEDARRQGGISPGLLRLSTGLEEPEDLWADLEAALDRIASRRERAA
ncbi:trans-sulfuration enzyme family protein [Wenzhouxiangella marina]|uniref:Cystathionine gamma-synthase n=1 Tax=Wenzhouxiangella marina TaxID=1579979 RepID=A0A0K0XVR5_9GAMM|nr:PLP-dependent transferase [Wenzhouxiangella marina]AKS41778.1 cystathionine gamma-synthase [Wenzhouxiangella marina]MBB6086460.1 cystathionine beta-lyase/cystathionine gamma-synthase [Wenzhouxiangella marina]